MRPRGPAQRLSVFVGESDRWHHKSVYAEIVHRAHQAGLAGASVFHGFEGYGASRRVHTTSILSLSDDLPVVVVIVDATERIQAFLPVLDEVINEGMVIIDDVVATPGLR